MNHSIPENVKNSDLIFLIDEYVRLERDRMILKEKWFQGLTFNLKKLCVEIADFCRAIYASTENEQERQTFNAMLDKLNKR